MEALVVEVEEVLDTVVLDCTADVGIGGCMPAVGHLLVPRSVHLLDLWVRPFLVGVVASAPNLQGLAGCIARTFCSLCSLRPPSLNRCSLPYHGHGRYGRHTRGYGCVYAEVP